MVRHPCGPPLMEKAMPIASALRVLVLFALCVWTAANWFLREPVRRTVSPVHSTSRIPVSEHLPEKARAALEPCLDGPPPMTMESFVSLARDRVGLSLRETLERRLVRFLDDKRQLRYLTYRPESAQAGQHLALRLFALSPDGASTELELEPALKAMPPREAIEALLQGASVLSDLEAYRYRGEGLREWTLETENGAPRSVRFEEPGLTLECSSAHGPAACSCSREE